jgi:hypothetical protein
VKDWPQPFWAVILAAMGVELAVVALFSPAEKDIKIAVIGLGSSIVTGALGYIGGHMQASRGTIETSSTLPTPPVDPAQPKK